MFDTAAALRRAVSTRSTSAFRANQCALESRAAPSRHAESTALDYEGAKSGLSCERRSTRNRTTSVPR